MHASRKAAGDKRKYWMICARAAADRRLTQGARNRQGGSVWPQSGQQGRPPGEHDCATGAAFIFLVPPVPGRWVTVPGPGERYAAGSWPLRASSRAAILATAAACELVSGGSSAASAAAHALRPCSRDTRPASWSGQRSSAFFPGGSASLGACGVGGPAGDVPFEGGGMLGESPVGELGATGLVIGGPTPLHPTRSRRGLARAARPVMSSRPGRRGSGSGDGRGTRGRHTAPKPWRSRLPPAGTGPWRRGLPPPWPGRR
jgi:hypothetical protein